VPLSAPDHVEQIGGRPAVATPDLRDGPVAADDVSREAADSGVRSRI